MSCHSATWGGGVDGGETELCAYVPAVRWPPRSPRGDPSRAVTARQQRRLGTRRGHFARRVSEGVGPKQNDVRLPRRRAACELERCLGLDRGRHRP